MKALSREIKPGKKFNSFYIVDPEEFKNSSANILQYSAKYMVGGSNTTYQVQPIKKSTFWEDVTSINASEHKLSSGVPDMPGIKNPETNLEINSAQPAEIEDVATQ